MVMKPLAVQRVWKWLGPLGTGRRGDPGDVAGQGGQDVLDVGLLLVFCRPRKRVRRSRQVRTFWERMASMPAWIA